MLIQNMKIENILLCLMIVGASNGSGNGSVLRLLIALNVQGGPEVPRWDRGLEILPAAQLAVDKVNGDPSILPGYQLEPIQVDTGTCRTHGFQSEALINFFHQIVQEESHRIVGAVGLFCTSVAQLLSPLAGHQGISLVQISGSASPLLRNQERYPYLWHMIPSSTAYVDTVLEMMDAFEWRNIAIIGAQGGSYFHTAEELALKVGRNDSRSVTWISDEQVSSTLLRDLQQSGKRIVFASVETKVAVQMICLAYQQGVVWPNYTWIFPDHHIEDLLLHAGDMCNITVLKHALEKVYLLQFHFNFSDPHTQYSNILTPNPYAYAMHDSIQALALALNTTMDHLQAINSSLEDYRLGSSDITDMIERELMTLSFTGALGHVQFDTSKRERQTTVDILQIRNGTAIQVGSYNPASGQLVYDEDINPIQDMDIPRIKRSAVTLPVSVILLTVNGVCIIFTTIMLVFFVLHRKSAEIKASSLKLGLFTFVGCYLLFFASLLNTVLDLTNYVGPFLCTTISWCTFLGINFVYGTVLVRMLRVYRIFGYNGRMGKKRWSDWFLCIVVLIIVGNVGILLLVWSLVDVFTIREVEIDMDQAAASQPYIEVILLCHSDYHQVWFTLGFSEVGILILVVTFLAFKTRKIRLKQFKDTKKVNVYIFMNILLICVGVPFWWVLRTVNETALSFVWVSIGHDGTATLCQLLLIAPKVIPPLTRELVKKASQNNV